jgi:putative transposase
MNRRLHGWGFVKMHSQIRYKAAEKRIRVETVNSAYTSKTSRCREEQGYRPKQTPFKCSTPECWVSEYQADVSATLNIADRYLSGESHSREHTNGNDSAEEGGRLTVPQDSHADTDSQQETLGTYAS